MFTAYRATSIETYIFWRRWVRVIASGAAALHITFAIVNLHLGLTEPSFLRVIAIVLVLPYMFPDSLDRNFEIHKYLFLLVATVTGPALLLSGLLLEAAQTDPSLALITQRQFEWMAMVGILLASTSKPMATAATITVVNSIVALTHILFVPLEANKLGPEYWLNLFTVYVAVSVALTLLVRIRNEQNKNRMEAAYVIGAAVAHQLRTPLATIGNLTRSVNRRLTEYYELSQIDSAQHFNGALPASTIEQLGDALDSISEEVRHSNALIDILIANSKPIEKMDVPTTPVSIRAVIERAIKGYPYNNPFERSLVAFKSDSDFDVYGTENMLLHVLYNLIGNAVVFSQRSRHKPAIDISLAQTDAWNLVKVRDNGLGVPRDSLQRVFDPFFSQNSPNGTGIGLSFCKSVMEGLGGKIECQSEEGEYCEMILYFPQSPAVSAA